MSSLSGVLPPPPPSPIQRSLTQLDKAKRLLTTACYLVESHIHNTLSSITNPDILRPRDKESRLEEGGCVAIRYGKPISNPAKLSVGSKFKLQFQDHIITVKTISIANREPG